MRLGERQGGACGRETSDTSGSIVQGGVQKIKGFPQKKTSAAETSESCFRCDGAAGSRRAADLHRHLQSAALRHPSPPETHFHPVHTPQKVRPKIHVAHRGSTKTQISRTVQRMPNNHASAILLEASVTVKLNQPATGMHNHWRMFLLLWTLSLDVCNAC